MLRAVGFSDDDFRKPQIAVASSASDMTPCNVHLGELSEHARKGIAEAGGKPIYFNTITVTDGISMGTQGMRYSLVSREVIADSIETAVQAQSMDGVLCIGGCDKNMPGAMIGIARMNVPAVFVYGGTIKPGKYHGKDLTAFYPDQQLPVQMPSNAWTVVAGRTPLEASMRIELGPYAAWNEPFRLAANVHRCYREFAGATWDATYDSGAVMADMRTLKAATR